MKNLHARFENMLSANKAVQNLKNLGYKNAHIDAANLFDAEQSIELAYSNTRNNPNLSSRVLKSDAHMYSADKRPLIAASPSVSGMSSPASDIGSINSVVIVKVEDSDIEKVKSVLNDHGGII